jgi:fluoroquinolone transport system permease protein
MLLVVCIAPILAACFFRFGIPFIESILCEYFNKTAILSNYYLLFDLLLIILTPFMFCFASSMVMLTEYDENMVNYMAITPVGKSGYLISRLVFPAIISFFVSIIIVLCFSLTDWSILNIITSCLMTCILSIVISLLIFTFSNNRVEGMAMAKLSGLVMMGLPIPFFLFNRVQYLFSFLPSFWISKLFMEDNYLFLLPTLFTLFVWLWVLYKKFTKKLF